MDSLGALFLFLTTALGYLETKLGHYLLYYYPASFAQSIRSDKRTGGHESRNRNLFNVFAFDMPSLHFNDRHVCILPGVVYLQVCYLFPVPKIFLKKARQMCSLFIDESTTAVCPIKCIFNVRLRF